MMVGKVDFEWVESPVLFFAVCGPKFTKFGRHVGLATGSSQFATTFSD